jgi:hypothetical protein
MRGVVPSVVAGVFRCVVLATWFAALLGCVDRAGFERAAVEGRVTVDGAPLAEGDILLVPLGDRPGPKSGGRIENGAYHIEQEVGPVLGHVRVEIRALVDRDDGPDAMIAPEQPIAPEYNDASTLVRDITHADPNVLDFHLTGRRD